MKRMNAKSSKFVEKKKPSMAAAENFETTSMMQAPPMFANNTMTQTESPANTQEPAIPEQDNEQEQLQENTATIHPGQMMNAVKAGHEVFKDTSRFTNVKINGATAMGGPGCLSAINVKSFIFNGLSGAINSPADMDMAQAVSKVIAKHLELWSDGVVVPALPWYPAFSFFPGPVAPPMPNVPSPLSALPSFSEYLLTNEDMIFQEIMSELPRDMDNDINQNTVHSLSEMASSYFASWMNTEFIYNIMGNGIIPSFSPWTLGGPVVGKVIPMPGALK